MTPNKVFEVPKLIRKDLEDLIDNKLLKLFKIIVSWSERLNDEVWTSLNNTFLPFELKRFTTLLTDHFTDDQVIGILQFWVYLECFAYGQKECYPRRSEVDISRVISNNINSKYGESLTGTLADVKEKLDFNQRRYETRFLPMTFTVKQGIQLNKLFDDVHDNFISEQEFKFNFRSLVGEYYEAAG